MKLIRMYYSTIDGVNIHKACETIEEARSWAMTWVGEHPEIGSYYAISGDGIGKVMVDDCSIRDIFPENAVYVFIVHTLDSHEHIGPFGSHRAAYNWAYDRGYSFSIEAQRVDK